MKLRKAGGGELGRVVEFYERVIEGTVDIEKHAQWMKGKHPTEEGLRAFIAEGSLYVCENEEGRILGAMALCMYQGEEYHAVEWKRKLADGEVATLHTLGVSPECQGEGIGTEMIREAIRVAYAAGKKSLRLDVLKSNGPAQRLYERLGFVFRGCQNLYAENTGWTDFYFYEYEGGFPRARDL